MYALKVFESILIFWNIYEIRFIIVLNFQDQLCGFYQIIINIANLSKELKIYQRNYSLINMAKKRNHGKNIITID